MSVVDAPDVFASNGVIHVIDAVLLPPADDPGAMPPVEPTPSAGTIVEVAAGAGVFNTLLAAAGVADLADALAHPLDNYTVFAPTDEAFAALGDDVINALLADPAALREILLFHIIPGTVFSAEAFSNILGFDIIAGNGGTLNVTATEDGLAVNNTPIAIADIGASNGIVHVIESVLLPPAP